MEKPEYLENESKLNKAEISYVIGFIKGLAIRLEDLAADISKLKKEVALFYQAHQVPSSEESLEKKDHC